MKVETVQAAKPNVVITLSWGNAEQLYNMLLEAKAYSYHCSKSTDTHNEFITILGRTVDVSNSEESTVADSELKNNRTYCEYSRKATIEPYIPECCRYWCSSAEKYITTATVDESDVENYEFCPHCGLPIEADL